MILNCLILIFISIGFVSSKPIFKERIVDLTINQIKFSSENKFNIISSAHHPIIMNGVNIFYDNRLIGIGTNYLGRNVNYMILKVAIRTHIIATYNF